MRKGSEIGGGTEEQQKRDDIMKTTSASERMWEAEEAPTAEVFQD
jgi:hypothetical protein